MKTKRLLWIPVVAFWWRDVIRFLRQRNRIIGALATPLVFWLLVGSGFGPSFRNPAAGAAGGEPAGVSGASGKAWASDITWALPAATAGAWASCSDICRRMRPASRICGAGVAA